MTLEVGDNLTAGWGSHIAAAGALAITTDSNAVDGGSVVEFGGSLSATSVELTTGTNDDVISLLSLSAGVPLAINAGAGDDTIRIGSLPQTVSNQGQPNNGKLDDIDGLVTIDGGAGEDVVLLDDSGDDSGDLATNGGTENTVSSGAITGFGMAAGVQIAGVEDRRLRLGSGADKVSVVSSSADASTVIHTGDGDNTVTVQDAQGTVNAISGLVRVVGGSGGTDRLVASDAGNTVANAGLLDGDRLTGLGMGSAGQTEINGAAGIFFSNFEDIEITLGGGGDSFTVSHVAAGISATVDAGAGDDALTVGDNLSAIDGLALIQGGEGSDTLGIVSSTDSALTLDVSDDGRGRLRETGGDPAARIEFDGVDDLAVRLSSADDALTILDTAAATTVYAGTGADDISVVAISHATTLNLGDEADTSADSVTVLGGGAALMIDGQGGSGDFDSVIVDRSATTAAVDGAVRDGAAPDSGEIHGVLDTVAGADIVFTGTEQVSLLLGTGNDVFTFDNGFTDTIVNVETAAGDDAVTVRRIGTSETNIAGGTERDTVTVVIDAVPQAEQFTSLNLEVEKLVVDNSANTVEGVAWTLVDGAVLQADDTSESTSADPFSVINTQGAETTRILGGTLGTDTLTVETMVSTDINGRIDGNRVELLSGLDVLSPADSDGYRNYAQAIDFSGLQDEDPDYEEDGFIVTPDSGTLQRADETSTSLMLSTDQSVSLTSDPNDGKDGFAAYSVELRGAAGASVEFEGTTLSGRTIEETFTLEGGADFERFDFDIIDTPLTALSITASSDIQIDNVVVADVFASASGSGQTVVEEVETFEVFGPIAEFDTDNETLTIYIPVSVPVTVPGVGVIHQTIYQQIAQYESDEVFETSKTSENDGITTFAFTGNLKFPAGMTVTAVGGNALSIDVANDVIIEEGVTFDFAADGVNPGAGGGVSGVGGDGGSGKGEAGSGGVGAVFASFYIPSLDLTIDYPVPINATVDDLPTTVDFDFGDSIGVLTGTVLPSSAVGGFGGAGGSGGNSIFKLIFENHPGERGSSGSGGSGHGSSGKSGETGKAGTAGGKGVNNANGGGLLGAGATVAAGGGSRGTFGSSNGTGGTQGTANADFERAGDGGDGGDAAAGDGGNNGGDGGDGAQGGGGGGGGGATNGFIEFDGGDGGRGGNGGLGGNGTDGGAGGDGGHGGAGGGAFEIVAKGKIVIDSGDLPQNVTTLSARGGDAPDLGEENTGQSGVVVPGINASGGPTAGEAGEGGVSKTSIAGSGGDGGDGGNGGQGGRGGHGGDGGRGGGGAGGTVKLVGTILDVSSHAHVDAGGAAGEESGGAGRLVVGSNVGSGAGIVGASNLDKVTAQAPIYTAGPRADNIFISERSSGNEDTPYIAGRRGGAALFGLADGISKSSFDLPDNDKALAAIIRIDLDNIDPDDQDDVLAGTPPPFFADYDGYDMIAVVNMTDGIALKDPKLGIIDGYGGSYGYNQSYLTDLSLNPLSGSSEFSALLPDDVWVTLVPDDIDIEINASIGAPVTGSVSTLDNADLLANQVLFITAERPELQDVLGVSADVVTPGLAGLDAIAVADDENGRFTYGVNTEQGAVVVINADGSQRQLIKNGFGATTIGGASDIVVTDDYVYVASNGDDRVTTFARDAFGNLSAVDSDTAQFTFDQFSLSVPFDVFDSLAVSEDGERLYAAGQDGIVVYAIDAGTGTLEQSDPSPTGVVFDSPTLYRTAISEIVESGGLLYAVSEATDTLYVLDAATMETVPGGVYGGIAGAADIAVSDDGRFVYVTGSDGNTLSVFEHQFAIGSQTSPVTGWTPGVTYDAVQQSESSGDGMGMTVSITTDAAGNPTVGAVTISSGSIRDFKVDDTVTFSDPDGIGGDITVTVQTVADTLSHVATLRNGIDGVRGLLEPTDVAITPDGQFVMTTGATSNAVTVFERDATTGELQFVQVVRNNVDGVEGLRAPNALAFSADGSQTFVASLGTTGIQGGLVSFANDLDQPDPLQFVTEFDGVEALTLTTNAGDDQITLVSRPDPIVATTEINTGGGEDIVTLIDLSPTTLVNLGAGDDEAQLRATRADATVIVHGDAGEDDIFINRVGERASIEVFGDDDPDKVFVSGANLPASATTIVHGNDQDPAPVAAAFGLFSVASAPPGDTLIFDPQDPTLVLSPPNGSGSITLDGKGTLEYDTFEGPVVLAVAPTITFSDPPRIQEGEGVTLEATIDPKGDGTLNGEILFDLDADGEFGEASLAAGTAVGVRTVSLALTWDQLVDFGLVDGDRTYQIGIRATNNFSFSTESFSTDGFSSESFATLTIDNTPPTVSVTGAAQTSVDTPFSIDFTAIDPGDDRVHEWRVDWGDGSAVEVFGAGTASATHVFAEPGNVVVRVAAIDEDVADGTAFADLPQASLTVDVNVTSAQVVAGGSYTIAEGEALSLSSTVAGTPATLSWDINGDGVFGDADGAAPTLSWAQLQALSPAVNDDGAFNVSLRASYDSGDVVTSAPVSFSVLNAAPTATLSNGGPVGEGGNVTVSFADQSDPSAADTAAGFTYSYDFDNDGVFEISGSTSASAAFVPSDNGTHTVRAVIADKDGGSTELFSDVVVNEVAPTLVLDGAASVDEGAPYQFDLSAIDPGDDTIQSWIVDWGDGSAVETVDGATASLSHAFTDNGIKTVSVTAVDEDGLYTASKSVTVANVAPVLSLTSPALAVEGGLTVLTGTIADSGIADSFTLDVDWGDGSAIEAFTFAAGTTTFSIGHRYLDEGDFSISATVTDDDGDSHNDGVVATVQNADPVVAGFGTLQSVVSEAGEFTVIGRIEDLGVLDTHDVEIDWGDGTTSAATVDQANGIFTATHAYPDDAPTGTPQDVYTITATASDADGGVGTATTSVTVENVAPYISDVELSEPVIDENGLVTISGSFADTSLADTHTAVIDWGDGTTSAATVDQATGTFTATHRYLEDDPTGTPSDQYVITATVTDDDGGVSASAPVAVTVNNVAPELVFDPVAAIDENGVATLTGTITDPGTLDTFTLDIDWGDPLSADNIETFTFGPSATGTQTFTFTHQYLDDNPGNTPSDAYVISGTVTDDDGGVGATTTSVTVSNVAPVITQLSLDQTVIDEDGSVVLSGVFTDASALDTHTVSIAWGDGTISAATVDAATRTFTATHQYLDDAPSGTSVDDYAIVATVTDDDTGIGAANTLVTVNNVGPSIVGLTATPSAGEEEVVTVTGSIDDVGSLDTFTVDIDWGDGIVTAAAVDQATRTFTATHAYADDDPSGTASDLYTITATATDDDTGVATAGTTTTIVNLAPVVALLSLDQTVIDENGSVVLSGAFTDASALDTHTVSIDWGDGTASAATVDAATRTFTATHRYLDDNPTGTAVDDYVVTATVTDDDTGVGAASALVTVNNIAAVFTDLSNNAEEVGAVVPGEPVVLTGTFVDPGTQDTYTVDIDWGDGTAVQQITLAAGTRDFSVEYLYANPGFFTITATLADDDSGAAIATTEAKLTGVELKDGVLRIAGTAEDDIVKIRKPVDPVAYWNFNETGGTVVTDSAGTPQDGVFIDKNSAPDLDDAGPGADVAPFGAETGAHFHDTTKEYIAVDHDQAFELASGTIQLWFNTDRARGEQTLFAKDGYGFGDGGHLNIALDGDRLEVRLQEAASDGGYAHGHHYGHHHGHHGHDDGESHSIRTDRIVEDDSWHHLAFTFGETGMKLYLDGALVGENGFTGGIENNSEEIVIGGSNRYNRDDSGDPAALKIKDPFNGHIDEVAIFGEALDADQIASLRQGGAHAANSADGGTIEVFASFLPLVGEDEIKLFDASEVESILIVTGGGGDNIMVDASVDQPTLMDAGADDDVVMAGSGPAMIFGGAGNDVLIGGAGDDVILGEMGDDWIIAEGGNDVVDGGDGVDRLSSPDAESVANGASGDDGSGTVSGPGLSGAVSDYRFDFTGGLLQIMDTRLKSPGGVAYWSLNETAGETVADTAGTPQDGTFFTDRRRTPDLDDAGPDGTDAPFGAETGADFHGDDDEYIAAAHDAELELMDGTIQLWFNARNTHGEQTLIAKDHSGFVDGGHVYIQLDGQRLEVRLQGEDQSHTIRTDRIVNDDVWNHVAFTFGEGGMNLYLNGDLVGSDDYAGGIENNHEALVIGGSNFRNDRGGDDLSKLEIDNSFDGRIDEVAIFGQALDQAEVQRLISEGPQALIDAFSNGETIDGTDLYENVEIIAFADGSVGYVLGAGSENAPALSADEVQDLARSGDLVVLGDATQQLRLVDAWGEAGTEQLGESNFTRWQSGGTSLLVLDGVAVTPDAELLQPIAYWNLNELSGNVVADSAGTDQSGIFFDDRGRPDLDDEGPGPDVAPFGAETGADFHGDDDEYIAIGHDEAFEVADGTVQLWFNADDTRGDQVLFAKDRSGFVDGGHLRIGLDGERLEVRLQSEDMSHTIRTDRIVAEDVWQHLAFTFGAGGMKLYLNGELVGENGYMGGIEDNREAIVIGGSNHRNWSDSLSHLRIDDSFNGRIDEVAMFGEALNAAQVAELISNGPAGVTYGATATATATVLEDDWNWDAGGEADGVSEISVAGPGYVSVPGTPGWLMSYYEASFDYIAETSGDSENPDTGSGPDLAGWLRTPGNATGSPWSDMFG